MARSIDDRLDESKYERVNRTNDCLGGQWLWHVPETIRAERHSGEVGFAKSIEEAYKVHLKKIQQLNVYGELLLPSRTAPSNSHDPGGV